MAAALPLNTVRQFKVNGRHVPFVKVSHHGSWRQRWRSVAQVTRGKPYDRSKHWELVLRDNPVARKRQRKNRARAVRASNRERSRINRSRTIRWSCFYCVVHFSEAELLARTKKDDPAGWIVMVPCRTKRQALNWGQREEFGGRRFEALRGARIESDEPTIQRLAGYVRYVPNEGQAWIQKRTLEKQFTTAITEPLRYDASPEEVYAAINKALANELVTHADQGQNQGTPSDQGERPARQPEELAEASQGAEGRS